MLLGQTSAQRLRHILQQVGIRGRLVGSLAGIASLTVMAAGVAFLAFWYIDRSFSKLQHVAIPATESALTLARDVSSYIQSNSSLSQSQDAKDVRRAVAVLDEKHTAMRGALARLENLGVEPSVVDNLKHAVRELAASSEQLARSVKLRLRSVEHRQALLHKARAAHRQGIEALAGPMDDAVYSLFLQLEEVTSNASFPNASERILTDRHAQSFAAFSDLRLEFHLALNLLTEAASVPSAELLQPIEDRFAASGDRVRKAIKALDASFATTATLRALDQLMSFGIGGGSLFRAREAELSTLAKDATQIEATKALAENVAHGVDHVVDLVRGSTERAAAAARESIHRSRIALLTFVLLSLFITTVAAWFYVGRGLINRLRNLHSVMLSLADGKLDVQVPRDGLDDISRMGAAVEVFKQNALRNLELEAEKERDRVDDLKQREASFRLLFESNPLPMWVYDVTTLRILAANEATLRHYGYPLKDLLTLTVAELHPLMSSTGIGELLTNAHSGPDGTTWHQVKADGSQFDAAVFARKLPHDGKEAALVAIVDITERQRAEERVKHMARHDALTGLPNRVLFRERIDDALLTRRPECKLALLCIDLDYFKTVNDTLGHGLGDELLKVVTDRLQACIRNGDTVARLGGDEFAVIQTNIRDLAEASALARRIIESLSQPFRILEHDILIGASIGVAAAPDHSLLSDELLKSADLALYRAKSLGRGCTVLFEKDMDAHVHARRTLELDLRRALAEQEFELYYQPLLNVRSGRVTGVEALLRWNHPTRGLISPAEFIPVAEETGFIVPIGKWLIRQACRDAAEWPSQIRVAINLSPIQFRSRGVVDDVVAGCVAAGISPRRLEVEITEAVLLQDSATTKESLATLKALGVRISLDDFGTGYSSLSYLQRFEFDKIKIDRSFVVDIEKRQDCLAIVRAVTGLAKSLSIDTTAEGVETEAQFELLTQEGCTEIQGFLVSEARPASELQAIFDQGLVFKAA